MRHSPTAQQRLDKKRNPTLDLSIIIPSKDEAQNLRLLLPELHAALDALAVSHEIIVVDPASPDGSREVVEANNARYIPEKEPGYGGALLEGFRAAQGTYLITLDADLSHPAAFIQELWRARDTGDIIIASRYVPGGQADQPRFRLFLSRILNLVFRTLLRTNIRDLSSGYRLYHRDSALQLAPSLRNFAVLVELLLLAQSNGLRITEIPFHYQPRIHGQSHARILRFGLDYLRLLFKMRTIGK